MSPDPLILNVNDDEATRYATTRVLRNAGWQVLEATTGEQAFALLERRPSLVVLDVKLPDISGFEVCRRIKANPITGRIPVLHLSAHRISSHDKAYGLDSGADGYLAQPVEPVELAAMVRALLRANEGRQLAERAALATAQTQRLTAALAEALTPMEVCEAALTHGLPALGAYAGVVLSVGSGEHLDLVGALGYPKEALEGWQHVPLSAGLPVTEAARTREPVWVRGREELFERFPSLRPAQVDSEALVALPLVVRSTLHGVVGLSFRKAQSFDDEQRAFAVTLARLCAQALQRARLFHEATLARAQAEEAVRARDEFLAIASHELKNPLSALQLQIQTALRRGARGAAPLDNARFTDRLQMMDRSVGRLSRLIDDLLDVSRISAGRLELGCEEVDLHDVIEEVASRVHDELKRSRSTLTVKGDRGLVGRWDRSRLDQVATNLVGNAIKYGQGNPVEVVLQRSDGGAILRVRDRGVGIAPEDLARIFDRFERASASRHIRGLGLGLFIVRAIVQAMGGTIRVESTLGEGSTFTVELPLDVAQTSPGRAAAASAP